VANRDDLARLRDHLLEVGYTVDGVAEQLGADAHAALGRGELVPAIRASRGGSARETYIQLFLLGLAVPANRAAALPSEWLERDGEQVRAALDVRPYATAGTVSSATGGSDWYVVSDLGTDLRPGRLRPDHVLGIGGASLTLAGATVRPAVASALDVGTGCGVQALHLSEHAAHVTATDSNPRALRMAELSAALSGLPRPEMLAGDLWEPVAGRRFDLVVSNPPFVIGPTQRYEYRDSGLPGDEICRQLLATVSEYLADGGYAQFLANWLHLDGVDWRERLAPWLAETGCDAWVVQREVTDPASYVAMWLRDSGDESDRDLAEEWLQLLDEASVEGIGFGLISLRAAGTDSPVLRMEELYGPIAQPVGPAVSEWFERVRWLRAADDDALLGTCLRVAPDVALEALSVPGIAGWEAVRRTLVSSTGWRRRGEVDEAGAALVAGCDGETPLRTLLTVLDAAYGIPADVALEAVRDLVETGFLLP
jgi:methylase of polypeptide subunit release factors